MSADQGKRFWLAGAIVVCAALLSLITVFNQVKALGLSWHEREYRLRLEAVDSGLAAAPAQYRLLSDGLTLAICRWAERMEIPRAAGGAMIAIRLLQNTLLFLLTLAYYRRLGIPMEVGLLGLSALAWGMMQGNYHSDLAVNTYSDVICYILAAWLILGNRAGWVVLLMLVAALNRETCVLIALMLLVWSHRDWRRGNIDRPMFWLGMASLAVYAMVLLGSCLVYGVRPWGANDAGLYPGWALFVHNILNPRTWANGVGVWGVMPVLALLSWRVWPRSLRAFGGAVVPIWIVGLFIFGTAEEGPLLLVPQVLVFLPGASLGLIRLYDDGMEREAV